MPEETNTETGEVGENEQRREIGLLDVIEAVTGTSAKEAADKAIKVFEVTAQEAQARYGEQVNILGKQSLDFLDKVAEIVLDPKEGNKKSLWIQAGLGVFGIPGGYSVGDVVGVLRGYRNLRRGETLKGALELITALLPGVPTPPFHAAFEKFIPDAQKPEGNKK